MKEHAILFFNHIDDYLDTCMALNGSDGMDIIRKKRRDLKDRFHTLSKEEYQAEEADIFIEFIKLKSKDIV